METFWNVMITDGMVVCINILLILMEYIHTVDWHLHTVKQENFRVIFYVCFRSMVVRFYFHVSRKKAKSLKF